MLTIEQLATTIVERWETGDLAEAVREMAEHLAKLKQARLDHDPSDGGVWLPTEQEY